VVEGVEIGNTRQAQERADHERHAGVSFAQHSQRQRFGRLAACRLVASFASFLRRRRSANGSSRPVRSTQATAVRIKPSPMSSTDPIVCVDVLSVLDP
jgi:hypothetical protein